MGMVKLKEKYKQWKWGQMASEEYRDTIWMCRDGVRKAKVQMKLNLVEEVKNNKRSFRYIRQKRQEEESVPPLINEKGELASY